MVTKTSSPLPVKAEAGRKYSWCSCGFRQTMPLCDHSHREISDKNPLNSSPKKPNQCILAALGHKHLLTAMAAIAAGKCDGYRN